MKIGAVLFDMDGTLIDSHGAIIRSWTRISEEYGLPLDEILAVHAGRPAWSTLESVAPWLGAEKIALAGKRQLEWEYDDLGDIVAIDGALELIDGVAGKNLPWAVVTSADERLARARMGAVGIDPPLLISTDDITAPKPDPEGYLLAARRLGVPPEACLVVEDAPAGVAAGRAAGMRVVGVAGITGDSTVTNLVEILDLLS
ncbi:HAD-IA family hydrolase [Catenuloplanes japonicus]|uniref:HAD-IA family hydrolase n=1 Tax=Catenuloplanes japonicus TaxID=33876 RepID=UPI0005266CFB|nr:HAD-IA family hydrolase [Catenuloplanes japonicus]